jgi:phosphate starvation-inducible PhoH-like protein
MKLVFDDNRYCMELYGQRESHLKILEHELAISIHTKGNEVFLAGNEQRLDLARDLLMQLYNTIKRGFNMTPEDVRRAVRDVLGQNHVRSEQVLTDTVLLTHRNRRITPRGLHQKEYVDALRNHDLVFGIGPAGTGKTYLAMAQAIETLNRKAVERIILTRPAVEAGERLGFLPGSLQEKINPYLRPLYDALHDMVDLERAETMLARGVVEVAPLAFMRGRTLNNAFVILDEAQNTTNEQMKMFLTRLGYDSQAVVTGDITQNDLPKGTRSGLEDCIEILQDVEGIRFCYFDDNDVVRHPLVQRIVRAYARSERKNNVRKSPNTSSPEHNGQPDTEIHTHHDTALTHEAHTNHSPEVQADETVER